MNHTLLQERFDAAAKPDADFLTDYNAATVEVPKPVLVKDFAQYADANNLTPKLLAAEMNPAIDPQVLIAVKSALRLLSARYDDFSMEAPAFQIGMAGLVQGQILTQDEVDGVLALGKELKSQSVIDHGRETTQADLQCARNQDSIAAVESLVTGATNSYNAALMALQENLTALQNGEAVTALSAADVVALFEGELG